jgi:hypothetical protein
MDDLNEALSAIHTMRSHLARSAAFPFYGPLAIAGTAGLGAIAAGVQAVFVPAPALHIGAYLTLWTFTAVLACGTIGLDVSLRARRAPSVLADELVQEAASQLLPAGAIAALLTAVLVARAPQTVWMLPGLWQMMLALGIFSACRTLPGPMRLMGFWYAATGLACLVAGQTAVLSPWQMGLPFGLGELLAAAILFMAGRHE